MRFVKDDLEIAALREAFAIQTQVYEEIMRTLKPGVNRSVGEAILDRTVGMCGVRYGRLSDGNTPPASSSAAARTAPSRITWTTAARFRMATSC
ncbi:MAG: hypothetical protein U0521_23975 [Anaerolineae bacterium]